MKRVTTNLSSPSLFAILFLLASIPTYAQELDTTKPHDEPDNLPADIEPSKMLNTLEHGLVPDSTEDQTDKLNAIMKMVGDNPQADTVYVPTGEYRIAKPIYLRPKVNLVGDGIGRTVFCRGDDANYLVRQGGAGNFEGAVIANLSFRNQVRTLLMSNVHHLRFQNVEFEGGLVRFEKSSRITIWS